MTQNDRPHFSIGLIGSYRFITKYKFIQFESYCFVKLIRFHIINTSPFELFDPSWPNGVRWLFHDLCDHRGHNGRKSLLRNLIGLFESSLETWSGAPGRVEEPYHIDILEQLQNQSLHLVTRPSSTTIVIPVLYHFTSLAK